jgi:hypothetical protein
MNKHTRLLCAAFAVLGVAAAGDVQGAPILDQTPTGPAAGFGLDDTLEWQQQVTDGIGGILAGVQLFTAPVADNLTVSIGLGPAPTGAFAFTKTEAISPPPGTFVDTSAAGIFLQPGETFVIDVSGGSGQGFFPVLVALIGSPPPYPGGDLFLIHDPDNGGNTTDYTTCTVLTTPRMPAANCTPGVSLLFATFITPESPVPEPGTLALLSGALIGFALIRRRRGRRADAIRLFDGDTL